MAEIKIRESVWHEFEALAQRKRRNPRALAETVLREYVQQVEDEELLESSMMQAAQRAKFREEDTEEIIREYRRKNASKVKNGRAKKANSGGS